VSGETQDGVNDGRRSDIVVVRELLGRHGRQGAAGLCHVGDSARAAAEA
jgi:hypothetical protein